jgi:adenylate cyclase
MFTDLAGFTPTTHRDEAAAMRLLREQDRLVRPLLEAHRGRKVKSMGDGLLVEFPNARDAVECAVEIQRRIHDLPADAGAAPLRLRVGIHLGDVERRGGDILGDAVNIASRIEPLADPGGICLSAQVYDQVHNKVPFQLERIGPTPLKGLTTPVEVFRVIFPWTREPPAAVLLGVPRLAVLPLANISPDARDEYFADGLTEELITVLSQVGELRVIARTSVGQYKSSPKPITQIGAELRVGTVLEGSVRKSQDRLRITVQLIDVATEEHLWAHTYDRELRDTFAVQAEIAQDVAEKLKVRIRPADVHPSGGPRPVVPESYAAYLRGRSLLQGSGPSVAAQARHEFERALELDPTNARAYYGLATVEYREWATHLDRGLDETQMSALVAKCIELDPQLSEAHALRGTFLARIHRYEEGEREYLEAIRLNPGNASAHLLYSMLLQDLGRTDSALRELAISADADPISTGVQEEFARLLIWLGRFDEAEERIARLVTLTELDEPFMDRTGLRVILAQGRGDIDAALARLEAERRPDLTVIDSLMLDADVACLRGDRAAFERLVPGFKAAFGPEHLSYNLAGFYIMVGDLDNGFYWLEESFRNRGTGLRWWRLDPRFAAMRADPRWPDLLRRLGLPP